MKYKNNLERILKSKVFEMRLLTVLNHFFPSYAYKYLQLNNNKITLDEKFIKIWWRLLGDKKIFVSIRDAYNIYFHLLNTISLGGAIAEVGVYKGGTSKLICECKSDLPFYLFDTFEGMPAIDNSLDLHSEGDFCDTSLEQVKRYLKDYNNVDFHKGFFPNSAKNISKDVEFCFVHLDVDIYESTLTAIEYFYPRLKQGGIIISHDYNSISCPGVKKAFDEYCRHRRVVTNFLWDTQVMIRKY